MAVCRSMLLQPPHVHPVQHTVQAPAHTTCCSPQHRPGSIAFPLAEFPLFMGPPSHLFYYCTSGLTSHAMRLDRTSTDGAPPVRLPPSLSPPHLIAPGLAVRRCKRPHGKYPAECTHLKHQRQFYYRWLGFEMHIILCKRKCFGFFLHIFPRSANVT
jgi:hypothetical protein